jgi:hypothetical protein
MDASPHRDLLSFLAEIPDPRSRHGRQHSLSGRPPDHCDAMFCQRDRSQETLDAKGHYLGFAKEDRPTLLADIQAAFAPAAAGAFSPSSAADLAECDGHGDDPRQRTRPSGTSDVTRHHGAERGSGLAGRRPSG